MKRGHTTGQKKERTGATDWYASIDETNCQRVEAEWAAKAAQTVQKTLNTSAVTQPPRQPEPSRSKGASHVPDETRFSCGAVH